MLEVIGAYRNAGTEAQLVPALELDGSRARTNGLMQWICMRMAWLGFELLRRLSSARCCSGLFRTGAGSRT